MRYLIFIALLSLGFSSSIYGQVSESCIDTYSTTHTYSNDDYSNLGGVILYDNSLSSNICDGGYINETGELITINSVTYESTYDIVVHYPDLSQVHLDVEFIDIEFHCDATFSEILCNPITGGSPTFTQYQFNYAYSSVKMYLVYDWYQDEPEGNWQLMLAESTFTEGDFLLDSQQLSEEHLGRLEETIQPANSTISDILYTRMLNAIEEFVVPEIEDSSPDCHEWCSLYGLVYDECGICNGSGIPDGDCDCEGNILDECGVCGGTGIPEGDCDCDGNTLDECGVCGGDGIAEGACDCDGNTLDECGVCGGSGIADGECDCDGNVIDECGVCGGSGIADGECDCDGNVIDECGVCGGGNSSCIGCTNSNATNYDSTATIDDGSCIYDQDAYDSGVASVDITSDNQEAYDAGVASVVCPDGGSSCPGDLDNDGAVATTDLLIFLSAYGGTCEVDEDLGFSVCGDDINHEGYDYSTVLIGDQCWFSENCRYLPEVSPSGEGSETDPYYYVYDYQGTDVTAAMATENYETYGVLYNWPAVMTEGICPSGWHIPTDEEWQTMEISLGMSESEAAGTGWRGTDEGHQMKSTSGWNSGGNGSNSSGFTGLPGGYRYSGGFDYYEQGYWWSASESGSSSWLRVLYNVFDSVYRNDYNRVNGFSARCVRD